jgi:nitrate/nitrite transporter NarK
MPIAIILLIMPAALLGTVMVLMTPADDRTTALAMGFSVVLVAVLFIAFVFVMRDQHPSQANGDSHLPQDRSPGEDDEDEGDVIDFDDAVTPTMWLAEADEKADEAVDLGRFSDDGAGPRGR